MNTFLLAQANDVGGMLKDAAGAAPPGWLDIVLVWGAVLAGMVVTAVVVRRILRSRAKRLPRYEPTLQIDVMSLPAVGPPPSGPALYYYNVPVRLAAIVLAPAGRVRELPPINELSEAFDAIVPGLTAIIASHRPVYRRWPAQVSVRGFAHMFFSNVRLPGQGGKGTPWCSAAGVFKLEGKPLLAGLLMRAETTTSLGQHIVEEEAQWLDILRIKM